MKLSKVVNRFAKTQLSGWDGQKWVENIGKIDFLPFSRFVSKHEFDTNVQYVLISHESQALDDYDVVRVESTGQAWMVGMETYDVSGNPYSKMYTLRRADSFGELYEFTKVTAASGMAKTVSRTLVDTIFCDVERVTAVGSKEFINTKYPDVVIWMPRNTPLTTDKEMKIDGKFYDVREVYKNAGFVACRALAKDSL